MEDISGSSASVSLSSSRFTDGRASSDSGISSRGGSSSSSSGCSGSSDERSGSHSSALSGLDENSGCLLQHQQQQHQALPLNRKSPTVVGVGGSGSSGGGGVSNSGVVVGGLLSADRFYSYPPHTSAASLDGVRGWRDPNLFLVTEPSIRHVESVQHQSLLMSHPTVATGSPSSSSSSAAVSPSSMVAAPTTPSAHYPHSPSVTSMITSHPLHHQLTPHNMFPPIPEILWKQRYPVPGLPMTPSHLHPVTEELLDRERAYVHDRERQDRMLREREQEREADKQQKERQKHQDRERQEKDQLEKQRALISAVDEHFAESFKRSGYLPNSVPLASVTRVNEEERKRVEREQQRLGRPELREREKITPIATFSPYVHNVQIPKSVTTIQNNKNEYLTSNTSVAPVIQNRGNPPKSQMTLPKSEPVYNNMYGYPAYPKALNFFPDKLKIEQLKSSVSGVVVNSLANAKSSSSTERELMLASGVPLTHAALQQHDMKNSVIVKNDGKNMSQPHMLTAADRTSSGGLSSHSSSPKLRINEPHYLQSSSVKSCEYRSPTQSPSQATHIASSTSPHQMHVDAKLHQRQQSTPSSHHRQSPLPSTHHRQSPHHRHSPLPALSQQPSQLPHHRQSPHPSIQQNMNSPPEQRYAPITGLYQKTPVATSSPSVGSYSYTTPASALPSVTAVSTPTKPKVSSPAPPHMYSKPTSGITSGTPICRAQEISLSPVSLSSKALIPPSPYQQLSQHQLPPNSSSTISNSNLAPPPAHSSRSTSSLLTDLRMFSQNISNANHRQPAADLSSSSSVSTLPSQTQPLNLGIREQPLGLLYSTPSPPTSITSVGPIIAPSLQVATELTKRKWDEESVEEESPKKMCVAAVAAVTGEKTLDRVAEPSPLIANAATTFTTVVNVAADTVPVVSTLPEETNAAIAPPPPCSSPNTPVKLNPSTVDGEKSNSPKPPSYGGHKLKKAWLQRHSGEDVMEEKPRSSTNGSLNISENDCNVPVTSACNIDRGATGSPLSTTVTKDISDSNSVLTSLNNSLSSIGSMAVNSISKSKTPKGSAKKNAAAVAAAAATTSSVSTNTTAAANSSCSALMKENHSSPVVLNGHLSPKSAVVNSDESSSSDTETKLSPKRMPPKMKRKKHMGTTRKSQNDGEGGTLKRKILTSTSSTDSDKESASEKDSDNSCTGKKAPSGGNDDKKDSSRKRGRKPKVSGSYSPAGNGSKDQNSSEEPKEKKFRDESREQKDPFPKPPISQLKKTGESFLQDGPCFEVAPKLAKCRECRWTANQRSRNNSNIFCRFYAFRRLRYTKNGQLAIAGFSDPHKDAKQEDLNLWLPNMSNPPIDLDLEVARFTLVQVGDQFCDLLTQEAEALQIHISEDKKVAWKRVIQGVREMCDVCETTLFNFHWACSKCGFVVCIDCYKGRKNGTIKVWGDGGKDRDEMSWLLCTNRQAHEQEKLMLTQIIAGDSLMTLAKLSHESRAMWEIAMNCGCPLSAATNVTSNNGICKEILRNLKQEKQKKAEQLNGQVKSEKNGEDEGKKNETDSPLTWLADVALSNQNKNSPDDDDSSTDSDDGFSTLRELLIGPNKANGNGSQPSSPAAAQSATVTAATAAGTSTTTTATTATSTSVSKPKHKKSLLENFDEVISNVGECNDDNGDDFMADSFINGSGNSVELKYFVRRHIIQSRHNRRREGQLPIRIMTLSESKLLYPDVPHAWLCDGKLLRLLDPCHPGNYTIFQDQWRRGQPVIVSDVTKNLNRDLWHPDSFIKDFGDVKNDLINCMTGNIVPNQPMRKFWEGFEYQARRLKDEKGNGMLLKLKDWPPGEDFAEMLPSRYYDLMNVLPLGDYTQRKGKLNLASRLPEYFVRPDLGPKMYNAYGSAMYPNKGTTNLHLDISDAVNVMVYVGIPKDGDNEEHIKEAYRAIDEAGCDILTRRRVREKGELPGALWHIYSARDADKIRDLLNKVAIERGARLEPNHDPIHDQSWYLDGPLRERLFKEYSVEGYAIVQCMGDAVFVPAGAPHQVRNLHNCIKVAEDFVSPENVSYCFHLTQEFRDLSDTHSNHEDKLQIKNIMYHAVKDSLSVLGAALLKNSTEENPDGNTKPTIKSEPENDT